MFSVKRIELNVLRFETVLKVFRVTQKDLTVFLSEDEGNFG